MSLRDNFIWGATGAAAYGAMLTARALIDTETVSTLQGIGAGAAGLAAVLGVGYGLSNTKVTDNIENLACYGVGVFVMFNIANAAEEVYDAYGYQPEQVEMQTVSVPRQEPLDVIVAEPALIPA